MLGSFAMSLASFFKRLLAFFMPPDEAPEASPVQIFDDAVRAARQRFLDLRATASPLYQSREQLQAQEKARSDEHAALGAKAAKLLGEGREKEALEAAAQQGRVEADRERIRKELADLSKPIEAVEERLRKIEAEVRALESERDRSAALLKSADARMAVERILTQHAGAQGPDLALARDAVSAKLEQARALEQIGASSTEAQLAELESSMAEDSARARLESIKRAQLTGPGSDAAGEDRRK